MKLVLMHYYIENKILKVQKIIEKDLEKVYFENQEWSNNGMWLHCIKNGKQFSIEFDPKSDEWTIK